MVKSPRSVIRGQKADNSPKDSEEGRERKTIFSKKVSDNQNLHTVSRKQV